jgi:uncharacterized protein
MTVPTGNAAAPRRHYAGLHPKGRGGGVAQSAGFHESEERLSGETMDRHRAIVSLQEELEAIDWYDQRVDATDDRSLAEVLAHNRDEEKEHAAMTLEWLRRHDAVLDEHLRTYLFTTASVVAVEAGAMDGHGSSKRGDADGALEIGDLRPLAL